MKKSAIVCRCEDITKEEVIEFIAEFRGVIRDKKKVEEILNG